MKLKWQQAPVKTTWGDEMVVASVEIDNDHTVDLYCERSQTARVEAMFLQATREAEQSKASNFARTAAWLKACGKEPSAENVSVQAGCMVEEFCEFLSCLRTDSEGYAKLLDRTRLDLEWFASKLKRRDQAIYIPHHLRTDALDALCDTEVTGNGIAYLAGFDKNGADQEVLASNDAKLVDGKPVILEGGKIGKPEGWKAPDLRGFV